MQTIERGGYSREEILDVLHSKNSARNVRFRYDLLDKNGYFKKTLETVMSGEVSMSAFSTIKRTAKFKIKERYVPAHTEREQGTITRSVDTTTDFQAGIHDGTVATNGIVRLSSPASSQAPNWRLDSFQTNNLPTDWTDWGGTRGTYSRGVSITGQQCLIMQRTSSSGSMGIQTSSKRIAYAYSGDRYYISFFLYHPDTNNRPTYNYCLMDDGAGNLSIGGSGGAYEYVDLGNGWWRYDGYMDFPRSGWFGLLIADYTSELKTMKFCNIYLSKSKPNFEGSYITPELDFNFGEPNSRYVDSKISYKKIYGTYSSSSGISAPNNAVESRVSFDNGETWSTWSGEGETAVNGLEGASAKQSLSGLKIQFRLSFERYDHIDSAGNEMISAWVTGEYDITIPETTEINYLSDRIQPHMEIKMPDGFWLSYPLGVFLLSTPTRHDEVNGVYREIEAYDGLIVLDDDKFLQRHNIPAGTKYTEAVKDILRGAGITKYQVAEKDDTLSSDKEFKIGTSKLQAVNELLSAINYTPIWQDAGGYYVSNQYVSPADKREDYTYEDNELSVLYNGIEEELDLSEVANSWVVTQSNPDDAPLVSTKENYSEESPTSITNMGRAIVDFREVDDISDQATLDAYVERIAFEASQVFGKLKFKTALMPFHEYSDVLKVKYDAMKIDYKFAETGWTMQLRAGGEMTHEARRVVNV
jgi:hypothetical protein